MKLIEADFDHVLPFADGWFTAAASRLALMIATDPVPTLREPRRVTAAGGRIVTALWAPVGENGHVRRLDATLSVSERAAVLDGLDRLVGRHRTHHGSLALPRAMTLVTATV